MDLFSSYDPKDYNNLWNRARTLTEETGERLAITLHKAAKEAGFEDYYKATCYWREQLEGFQRARLEQHGEDEE